MNVLGRLFLTSRKDGEFFVRCRRTYVLNNLNSFNAEDCIKNYKKYKLCLI